MLRIPSTSGVVMITILLASVGQAQPNGYVPVYNVKSAPYNAYGDDSHTDTNAINSAISAACSAGTPGIVYLPEGTYLVTNTLSISCGFITLSGAGGRTTQSVLDFQPSSTVPLVSTNGLWNIRITQLAMREGNGTGGPLIQNKATYLPDGGIATGCQGLVIENDSFSGSLTGNNTSDLIYSDLANTDILKSNFNANTNEYAIRLRKASGAAVNINSRVLDCYFGSVGLAIIIDKDASSTLGQVEGVNVSRNVFVNTGFDKMYVTAVARLDISNNIIDMGSGYNVWLKPTVGLVDGVHLAGNYFGFADSNGGEIGVYGDTSGSNYSLSNVSVTDNRFIGGKYGVVVGPTNASNWIISGNIMQGNNASGSGGLIINGPNSNYFTVIGNNVFNYILDSNWGGVSNVTSSANAFH